MSEHDVPESTGEMGPQPQVATPEPALDNAGSSLQPGDVGAQSLAVLGQILAELKAGTASAHSQHSVILSELKASTDSAKAQRILGIAAIIIAILALINDNRKSAERTENKIEASRFFAITVPDDGAEVSRAQRVRGTTPLLGMDHYVVVTLVRTGASYVQDEPVLVSSNGSFSGVARFDDIPVTDVDELILQVLATKSTLKSGLLTNIPNDAIFSTRVSVHWAPPVPVEGQIVITAPTNDAEVGFDDTISGTTTLPGLHHFIVVTPLKVRTASVQDQPVSINPTDGTFTGRARFGGAQLGVGEQFAVRILATQTTLPAGPLIQEPADAIFSNSVTVKRRK